MAEARRAAKSEGVSLNQFINVAVAEKVSAVRAEAFLRVAPAGILQILEQAAASQPDPEPVEPMQLHTVRTDRTSAWRREEIYGDAGR